MVRLTNFLYCLNVDRVVDTNGKGESLNASGIMTVMTPEFVPGAFSFSIIFSILNIDVSIDNNVKLLFKAEDGAILIDTNEITIPANTNVDLDYIPNEFKGYNLSMDFRNVVFEREGVYTTEVYFNGELIGSTPIYVKGKR